MFTRMQPSRHASRAGAHLTGETGHVPPCKARRGSVGHKLHCDCSGRRILASSRRRRAATRIRRQAATGCGTKMKTVRSRSECLSLAGAPRKLKELASRVCITR